MPILAAAGANAALAFLLLFGFGLLGLALVPARLRPAASVTRFAVSLSLGTAAFGWSTWIFGSVAGTRALPALWLALAAFSLWSLRPWVTLLLRVARHGAALLRSTPFLSFAIVLAAFPLVFPLCLPLVDNDGIRYHVALPKLYLLTGRVFLYPWDMTGAYPQLGNMLYMAGLFAGTADTAKFLNTGFLATGCVVLALTLHRSRASRRAALAGVLLYLASPVVGIVAGTGFIDHIALFHVVAALATVFRRGSPLFTGLALGAALATKLTLAPGAVALGLAAALLRPRRERLRAFVIVPAATAAVLAPFAIRNAVALGDPFYPILSLATGRPTPGVSPEVIRKYTSFNSEQAGPLGVVWTTPRSGEDDETAGIHHLAGLFLLFFGLRDRLVRLAACVALPLLAYAAFATPPTRYLLPMLWGLSVGGAAVLAKLWAGRGAWLAIPLALPGLVLSWDYQARNFGAADYLLGRYSKEEYLARTIPGYRAAPYVNSLPPGGVMAGDFPGPVYFDRPWIVEGLINDAPLTMWVRSGENADQLLARLHENGIRWLLATPAFGGGTPLSLLTYAPDPSKAHVMAALRSRLRFVATVDRVDVWEVPATPVSAPTTSARP
ncbi:MAG: hypothetical protein HY900_12900 [Deltaproteobacteria bacterium]|nr:hypothetical protein [Deltaproteobacteria bacterium]